MFNFGDYFSKIAGSYLQRYQSRLAEITQNTTPATTAEPTEVGLPVGEPEKTAVIARPDDEALIGETPAGESAAPVAEDNSDSVEVTPGVNAPVEGEQDGSEGATPATYEARLSQLRYGLDLSFNLSAIERTVSQLSAVSDGETTETTELFERLSSANFGLSADLRVSGAEVNASGEVRELPGNPRSANSAARYLRHNGLFVGRGMQKSAAALKSKLNPTNRAGYQLAVNRFALRYKSDVNFSFTHFERFQSQVTAMNGSSPEALAGYNTRAGELAEFTSNDVMGAFFDTVDAHLEQNEEALVAKIEEFFQTAARELNLSEEAVQAASENLTSTVEAFFDRVGSAVDALEMRFAGDAENSPENISSDAPQLNFDVSDSLNAPKPIEIPETIAEVNPADDYMEALLDTLEESAEKLDEHREKLAEKRSEHGEPHNS